MMVSMIIFHGFDKYFRRGIEFASIGNDDLKNDTSANDEDNEPKFCELKTDTFRSILQSLGTGMGTKNFFNYLNNTVTQISKIMLFYV